MQVLKGPERQSTLHHRVTNDLLVRVVLWVGAQHHAVPMCVRQEVRTIEVAHRQLKPPSKAEDRPMCLLLWPKADVELVGRRAVGALEEPPPPLAKKALDAGQVRKDVIDGIFESNKALGLPCDVRR